MAKGMQMGMRQEQREQRRWQILKCALDLFVRRGFQETTVNQIAEAASMSMGLMFHYFSSKEELYLELVTIGAKAASAPKALPTDDPIAYFRSTLKELFALTESEPWVPQMFMLMARARREGTPSAVREAALKVDQAEYSAKVIERGQSMGQIREGDPMALSQTFWASVQGVMEQRAQDPGMKAPDSEWLLGILAKPQGTETRADR